MENCNKITLLLLLPLLDQLNGDFHQGCHGNGSRAKGNWSHSFLKGNITLWNIFIPESYQIAVQLRCTFWYIIVRRRNVRNNNGCSVLHHWQSVSHSAPSPRLPVQTLSVPSISLFGLECLEGREITTDTEIISMAEEGLNHHILSIRVNSGW